MADDWICYSGRCRGICYMLPILISQSTPLYPIVHTHTRRMYENSTHTPFVHGLAIQALTASSQLA